MVPVLFLIAMALKFAFISNPLPSGGPSSGGILENWIYNGWWKVISPGMLAILAITVILFSGLYLNYLLNNKRMFPKTHLLTALSFTIFTSIFPGVQYMHAGIVMLPVIILLFRYLLLLYQTPHPRTTVVNIGLIAGAGTLLYHPFWWMLPCCYWGLALMRPFKLNEWVLLLVGFAVPAYILLSYEYLTNQWNPIAHWPVWNPIKDWPAFNPYWAAAIILSSLWLISGFTQWQISNRRMLIQTRKNWYLLLLLGIFTIPSLFFPKGNLFEGLTLLLLPASALASNAFLNDTRGKLKTLFFWILLISAAIFSWATLSNKM
jgi:hypothetical protein